MATRFQQSPRRGTTRRRFILFAAIMLVSVGGATVEWLNTRWFAEMIAEMEGYDRRDGRQEAQTDIAQGILKWKIAGRVSDFNTRAMLLREQLGVELDWFAGCEGTPGQDRYLFAYNSTVRRHLVSLYGEPAVFAMLGAPPKRRDEELRG